MSHFYDLHLNTQFALCTIFNLYNFQFSQAHLCTIFSLVDLVTIGLCRRTQRPRGSYRWRETPVAASWEKAQTDPCSAELTKMGQRDS